MTPAPKLVPDSVPTEPPMASKRAANTAQTSPRRNSPPTRGLRFLKAYWVTFVVILSYLSLKFQSRFRSPKSIERVREAKHIRNARRIQKTIGQLQGLFIKIGQLISIMTNFLPSEFRRQLEGLQDQVPPRSASDIERRIREEFDGQGPQDLFADFSPTPVASASIGQVHIAHLHDGRQVAVKVQYPEIEQIVRSDLRILQRIFAIVGRFMPHHGLNNVYREIRTMILAELDFHAEAANILRIEANFLNRDDIVFPQVIKELSTTRVLTTEFETGLKVSNIQQLKRNGIDSQVLARRIVETYCQQIFTDGVYHADPHPGNLLVRDNPSNIGGISIVFLDFGAVAEVSPQMRQGIIELLQGGLAGDTQQIVRGLRQMGFVARGADEKIFDQIVEYFHERFREQISLDSFNLRDIQFDAQRSLENLADLRRMNISLREITANFHVPKEWILLERTLLLLMGLCTTLDPTMNPMTVIRPYLERFVLGETGDWSSFMMDTTKNVFVSMAALPNDARKFMKSAQDGELSVRFNNLDQATRIVYRMGYQLVWVALGIAGATIALVLEGRNDLIRAEWAWWLARISGGLFLWSWWTTRNWIKKSKR